MMKLVAEPLEGDELRDLIAEMEDVFVDTVGVHGS
jgi:hypothetical protein